MGVLVVMLQLLDVLPDAESRTPATKELALTPVGFPVIAPVEAVKLRPAGSDPVIENA